MKICLCSSLYEIFLCWSQEKVHYFSFYCNCHSGMFLVYCDRLVPGQAPSEPIKITKRTIFVWASMNTKERKNYHRARLFLTCSIAKILIDIFVITVMTIRRFSIMSQTVQQQQENLLIVKTVKGSHIIQHKILQLYFKIFQLHLWAPKLVMLNYSCFCYFLTVFKWKIHYSYS